MPSTDTQLTTVFSDALERTDPAARAAYLDSACRGNPELRRVVEDLLAAHAGAGRFLEPAATGAADSAPASALRRTDGASVAGAAGSEAATDEYGPIGSTTDAAAARPAVEATGAIIAGRYKLLQQIGEGGMGSVWMADQTEPVKRRVAVKLIRVERGQSKTVLSRFEAERQAIALMDHPHIAKLLDAGSTPDGSPFFFMELVRGIPLNDYCDEHELGIRERLQLFTQVCSAVQHAHQKGIIHRDLKPSNILVESHDGKPMSKVIDFGLAKATSALQLSEHTLFTAFGSVMGTPLYMAPEQANFNAVDVDTRADVYALGVILYELLTGTTPITRETMKKAAIDEMLKLIREQDAPTPSSRLSTIQSTPSVAANRQMEPQKLGRFVKGELDWIVMKALSKKRDRRYETASGFARDIERFLNNEAVAAGPPSASYRMRKFVKRNRGQVIAAGLVLLALLAGIAGTTVGLFEAKRQEALANERAEGERQATKKALAAAAEERKAKETVESVLGFVEDKIEECSTASRNDPAISWQVAALQAWLGHDEGYAATRQRILASAKGIDDSATALRAAQVGALRPSTDPAVLEASLALGRKAVELNKGQRERLALGMAEFRSGHIAAADLSLRSAAEAGPDVTAAEAAAFYRAMSLWRLGREDEAREVAARAAAGMRPLPRDDQASMVGNAKPDTMILWLACKEAKAMIGFAEPPAASAMPDGK